MAQHPEAFDCRNCQWERHCDAGNPAAADMLRIGGLGWLGRPADPEPPRPEAQPPVHWRGPAGGTANELVLRVCLLPMVDSEARELLRLAQLYDQGVMPHAGGYYDQPRYLMEAIALTRNAIAAAKKRTPPPPGNPHATR